MLLKVASGLEVNGKMARAIMVTGSAGIVGHVICQQPLAGRIGICVLASMFHQGHRGYELPTDVERSCGDVCNRAAALEAGIGRPRTVVSRSPRMPLDNGVAAAGAWFARRNGAAPVAARGSRHVYPANP